MDAAINFYELKQQFETLGFRDAGLDNQLREELVSGKDHFALSYREKHDPLTLHCFFTIGGDRKDEILTLRNYDALLTRGDQILATRSFAAEVSKNDAREVMARDALYPPTDTDTLLWILNPKEVREYLHENSPAQIDYWKKLNENHMNEQNLNYLKDNLKYLGFEDKLNNDLEKRISKQPAEFTLQTEIQHYGNKTDHTLHFKKSTESDMYFLNKHEATLKNGKPEEDKTQTFYVTKGHGITAKESFNLLEGRSVYKELVNKDKEPYKAWLKIDFAAEKDKNNNHIVTRYSDGYGYDLEKSLNRFPIKELAGTEQKEALLKSLQKGNLQQITVDKDNKPANFFIEASPQFKTINIYNEQHKTVKRETLLKQDHKNDQSQKQDKTQSRKRGKGL